MTSTALTAPPLDLAEVITRRIDITEHYAVADIAETELRRAIEVAAPSYIEVIAAAHEAGLQGPVFEHDGETYRLYAPDFSYDRTFFSGIARKQVRILACENTRGEHGNGTRRLLMLTNPLGFTEDKFERVMAKTKSPYCDWTAPLTRWSRYNLSFASPSLLASFSANAQSILDQLTVKSRTRVQSAHSGLQTIGQVNAALNG